MQLHQFSTDKLSGIRKLKDKGDAGFSDEYTGYAIPEISELVRNGTIHSIDRQVGK